MGIKQQLLNMIKNETSVLVQNTLVSLVSLLGSQLLPKGEWNELFPLMFELTKSPEAFHRTITLDLFGELASLLGCEPFHPYLSAIKGILIDGLNFKSDLKVRVAALNATSDFLSVMNGDASQNQFRDVLPLILECISACLNAQDETSAKDALNTISAMADDSPLFFKPFLSQITGII